MKALMTMSFVIAIGTAVVNEFSPFSLALLVVTGIGTAYQYTSKEIGSKSI